MAKKAKFVARLSVLSSHHGDDKSRAITVENDTPEARAEMAKNLIDLIRSGIAVLLEDGSKVVGYNAVTNEWIVDAGRENGKRKTAAVPAENREATGIAPVAGG